MPSIAAKHEIRILSDEEFNRLPYKYANDPSTLGLSDMKNSVAYIRHTGLQDVDMGTIRHEYDELLQKVSPHEEDGIRYKKFRDVLDPILSVASFIPGPQQPFVVAAKLGNTAYNIADRGFMPTDLLTLAPASLGAFKGAAGAAPGLLSKTAGAFKGAVGVPTNTLGSPTVSPVQDYTAWSGGKALAPLSESTSNVLKGFSTGATALSSGSAFKDVVQGAAPSAAKNIASGLATRSVPLSNVGFSDSFSPAGNTQSGALSRFLPSGTNLDVSADYISEKDILDAFGRVDANTSTRLRDAQQMFRGQGLDDNTKYSGLYSNILNSNELERNRLVAEADEANKKLYSDKLAAHKAEIMKVNNLDEATFNKYVEMARRPDASANFKEVFAAFV